MIPQRVTFRDDKNLLSEARDRLLWQFKNSENLCKFIMLFVDQAQEIYDLTIDAQEQRTLAIATGSQLDVIGELIGQERVGITSILGLFGFYDDDTAESFSENGVGGGRFIELNESATGPRYLEDSEYRRYIIGKIYKNHLRGATATELALIATTILDSVTKCQLIDVGNSGNVMYYFYAPDGITRDDELLITSVKNDARSEKQRIITAGAGINISSYVVGGGDSIFGFSGDSDPNTGPFDELTYTTSFALNPDESNTLNPDESNTLNPLSFTPANTGGNFAELI